MASTSTSTWIRVRDKSTGHEYDIAPAAFDEAAHEELPGRGHDAMWPNPPKHRTDKAGAPAAAATSKGA